MKNALKIQKNRKEINAEIKRLLSKFNFNTVKTGF